MARGSSHTCWRSFHDASSPSGGIGQRIVRSSSATTMSISVANGSVPRSAAMSATFRPFRPSFSAE